MKKILFILLNSISVIIEYLFIYLFFKLILNKNIIISLIMTFIILIIMIIIVASANAMLRKTSIEDKNRPCEEELMKIINKISTEYNKKFYLHYVSAPQPNPAWCVGNHIYINNTFKCDDIFLPGVVAHELGHAISGISHYTFIPSLKVSTILSRILNLTIVALTEKENLIFKAITVVLFIPYYIINLNNLIFTYHFLKNDEITANSIAAKLGYGEHLRCYYAIALKYDTNKLFRKSDFLHPSISLMIEKLNDDIKIKKELSNIYYIDNILVFADIKTKTFTIPSFIMELYPNSISGNELIKVTSENIKKVHYGAFRECENLEIIQLKNVEAFPPSVINNLNNLKLIKIDDINILHKIYLKYPNRTFSKKIYYLLVNKGILKIDE